MTETVLNFLPWDFEFVSDFEFRISDLFYLFRSACEIVSSTGRTPSPTGQFRVQLPQPVQSKAPNFCGIDAELVVNPLPLALGLLAARIVPRGVQREQAELAGVPVPRPHALAPGAFVDDIETMAGGAGVGAGPAAETSPGQVRPPRVLEAALQELVQLVEIESTLRPWRSPTPCGPKVRYDLRTTARLSPSDSVLRGSLHPGRRAWRRSPAGRPGRNRPRCRSNAHQSSRRPG